MAGKTLRLKLAFIMAAVLNAWKTVLGTLPLTLRSKAAPIKSLTRYGKVEQRNLPQGYTELVNVSAPANTAYANTALTILPTYKVELVFETGTLGNTLGNIFGGRRDGSSAGNGIRLSKLANNGVAMYGFDSTDAYESGANVLSSNTRYTFLYQNGVITLTDGSGTVVDTHTYTPDDTEGTPHWAINGYYAVSVATNANETKFISLRIWDNNGAVIAYYRAATSNSNSAVGMYDTISNALITPTRGTWTAGATTTPAPDRPMDLWCNNGVLRYGAVGKNLFDPTKVLFGYYRDRTTGIKTASSANFMSSDDGYIPCLPNTAYTFVGTNKTNGTYSKYNTIYFFDRAKNYLGASPYETFQPTTGTTPSDCYYLQIRSNPLDTSVSAQDAFSRFNWQLELGSTATTYEPFVGGIVADGTPETLTVSAEGEEPQTVTSIPMLLGIGDYIDSAELISGIKTGKVGVKVYTGEETFNISTVLQCYADSESFGTNSSLTNRRLVCTHFDSADSLPAQGSIQGICVIGKNGANCHIAFGATVAYPSIDAFKQWLAAQYAAGTPVIVLYPLATETTEQTTAQSLNSYNGTTIVDTVCHVLPVDGEVEYKG